MRESPLISVYLKQGLSGVQSGLIPSRVRPPDDLTGERLEAGHQPMAQYPPPQLPPSPALLPYSMQHISALMLVMVAVSDFLIKNGILLKTGHPGSGLTQSSPKPSPWSEELLSPTWFSCHVLNYLLMSFIHIPRDMKSHSRWGK